MMSGISSVRSTAYICQVCNEDKAPDVPKVSWRLAADKGNTMQNSEQEGRKEVLL